ncbi:MAG TPA: GNAT family protein [Chloroflexota bacterium]|nr:GNAT family protein [Chloroflexota bacterium]
MATDPPGPSQPVITITGERVALGPPHRGLLPLLWKWENDLALSVLSGDPARPLTPEALEAEYERYSKSGPERVQFVVYEWATTRPIGLVGLSQINYAHRTAELGISLGESDCWGKGYGTEATRLVLDYAFTMLGLHNVMLRVYAYNERARRAYLRAGFREIGRRREAHRLGTRVVDEVLMDCLATEFQGSVLQPYLPDAAGGAPAGQ